MSPTSWRAVAGESEWLRSVSGSGRAWRLSLNDEGEPVRAFPVRPDRDDRGMTNTAKSLGSTENADSAPDQSGPYVQSLARGLRVIKAFDGDHPQMTLSDIARSTGLTRATSRRFLLTLVELGYVKTDGRMFAL